MMNDQFFLDRGYKYYGKGVIDSDAVECLFQKCFTDEIGKKYFITVKKWDWRQFPSLKDYPNYTYEYEIQLSKNEKAVDMTFFKEWQIEDVENEVERIWSSGEYDYYERWQYA